jgi:phosphatidylglycerophosphate synthase
LKTPLTPNQVTLASLGFGFLAGYFFSRGRYPSALAAAVCYQLAVVLDNCDGEIARSKNLGSELGGWLDIVCDILSDLALFTGVALGMWHQRETGPIALFLTLCLSGVVIHFFLVVLEKVRGFGPAVFEAPHPDHEKRKNPVLDVFDALREGDASWFVVLFAVTGWTRALLWTGGIYMQALWISAVVVNFRWTFGRRAA